MSIETDLAVIRARVADGTLDLRAVGALLNGKFDQDLPARILAAAAVGDRLIRTLAITVETLDLINGVLNAASARGHAELREAAPENKRS